MGRISTGLREHSSSFFLLGNLTHVCLLGKDQTGQYADIGEKSQPIRSTAFKIGFISLTSLLVRGRFT